MSTQLNDLRLQVERLDYDNKEGAITIDILKEQNQDATRELEELRQAIADVKANQKDPSLEDKEKKKQEKMALMMAKFDTVRDLSHLGTVRAKLDFSRARSLRKTNPYDPFLLNLTPSNRRILLLSLLVMISISSAANYPKVSRSCVRPSSAFDKARRRTR